MSEQPQQRPEAPEFTESILNEIDQIVQTHGPSLLIAGKGLRESIELSHAIQRMREIVSLALVESEIMGLMNTRLGFLTDRGPGKKNKEEPYGVAVVRDVVIEAMLRGARLTGNEVNIIAGNLYLTKGFYERMVREFPGVSDVRATPGVAQLVGEKGALQPFTVRWVQNGEEMIEERVEHGVRGKDGYKDERISVRAGPSVGADAIIGKATRKIFAAVHARLTGATMPTPDGDVDDIETALRKPRETGALDMAAFKRSDEPNRGHEATGMDQVTKPAVAQSASTAAVIPAAALVPPSEPPKRHVVAAPVPAEPETAPQDEVQICEQCGLSFSPAGFEQHLRIDHPPPAVTQTPEEMRVSLRDVVVELAGLKGRDLQKEKVTKEEREKVWGIFEKLTDGAALVSTDVPEAMLPGCLARAEQMLEGDEEAPEPASGLF